VEETAAKVANVQAADLRRVAERLVASGLSAAAAIGPGQAARAPEAFQAALLS
jgi:hypothetical protein